jgi:hypothetical protein
MYLYTGNNDTSPVKLGASPSDEPPVIHTGDGDIEVGSGTLPPGDGYKGQQHPGWVWYLGDKIDGHPLSLQLGWAKLSSGMTVQNVTGDFQGVGNLRGLTGAVRPPAA